MPDDRPMAVVAVDDGVQWRAQSYPAWQSALSAATFLDLGDARKIRQGVFGVKSAKKLTERQKMLLKWIQTIAKKPFSVLVKGAEAPSASRVRSEPCPVIGSVTYEGWTTALAKKSAHTFAVFHIMIKKAVQDCARAWKWSPDGLVVTFHTSRKTQGRPMGLAYNPGGGNRRISILEDMLGKYSIGSIYRTVVHEICHHAREEKYPRDRRNYTGAMSHDDVFCKMLSAVDSQVAQNPNACRYFVDSVDSSVVAAKEAAAGTLYTVSSGVLEVKPDSRRRVWMRWIPYAGTSGKRRTKPEPFTPENLNNFINRFPWSDRVIILVDYNIDPRHGDQQANMSALLSDVENLYPRFFSVFSKLQRERP